MANGMNNQVDALNNIARALDRNAQFPNRVFKDGWSNFLFFQSDWVFAVEFKPIVDELLAVENATECCLLNLTRTSSIDLEKSAAIFIDLGIDGNEYYLKLQGNGPSDGWLYGVDTFVCMSEKGLWCIYCEKDSDIAVIGFDSDCDLNKFKSILKPIGAKPIADLLKSNNVPVPPFNKLLPVWRSGFLQNYSV